MVILKKILKLLIPGFVIAWYHSKRQTQETIYWKGIYQHFDEAKKHCRGYDSDSIFTKVKKSALQVKRGEAAFERDSVAFQKPEFNWSLIASLYRVLGSRKSFHVVDFGGSLGSSYFQNRKHFAHIHDLKWSIVEQPHFVKFGQEELQDQVLSFYNSIEECLACAPIDVILFSSVLQYLPDPDGILKQVRKIKIPYVLLDRTAVCTSNEFWTVQTIHEPIYEGSYPAFFFNNEKLLERFKPDYKLLYTFENNITDARLIENQPCQWIGFLFESCN
ncbi:MAG: methyltransferase, TIGR04325 family [Cytophagaceae bacterium]|jgi:putative methyltransferase (TIGR04325 family)|nr:methyltransferase, TIGR04325 family [Cytophagaceae bacterium]